MITIKKFEVRGFRGLREFTFPMENQATKNLLLLGFNGTGKSSLNSALAFGFSGKLIPVSPMVENVTPLHYRHKSLASETPAHVKIVFESNNTEYWIVREIDGEGRITTTASDASAQSLAEAGLNSYCFLSRPQFASMIETVERDSWQRLIPFLGHEQIGALRDGLRAMSMSLKKDLNVTALTDEHRRLGQRATDLGGAFIALRDQLGLQDISPDEIARQLSEIFTVEIQIESLDRIEWTLLQKFLPGNEQVLQLTGELQSLNREAASALPKLMDLDSIKQGIDVLREIYEKPTLAYDLIHFEFLRSSQHTVANLHSEICPLCQIGYPNWEEVRASIADRLEILKGTSERFRRAIQSFRKQLEFSRAVATVDSSSIIPDLPEFPALLEISRRVNGLMDGILERQMSHPQGIRSDEADVLLGLINEFNKRAQHFTDALGARIKGIEDELGRIGESALTTKFFSLKELVSAHLAWREAATQHEIVSKQLHETKKIIEAFQDFYTTFDQSESTFGANLLAELESEVQQVFAILTNQQELKPIIRSVTSQGVRRADILIEDFYGLGSVTARDYLSEAYRSSLGLSIYFAGILKRAPQLRLLVLDDITQSADGTRKHLLANYISDVLAHQFQLIVLTHDDNWYTRLSNSSTHSWELRKIIQWSPDGIILHSDKWETLLDKAARKITNIDSSGGNELRGALEQFMDEICEFLKIRIPYQRKDLKFNVKRQHLVAQIKEAWHTGNGIIDPNARPLLLLENTQRLANLASHNGTYEQWRIEELVEAVQDVRDLIDLFTCKNLGGTCGQFLNSLTKNGRNLPQCKNCRQPITL